MSETPKTVFVTKYALTSGVKEVAIRSSYDGEYLFLEGYGSTSIGPSGYRLTREDAVKQANAMRDKKVASLKDQIAKLEAMTFA